MPYRVDVSNAGDRALDQLVELGALDVERAADGTLAALMPDSVEPGRLGEALGPVSISAATPRDAGSVWVLRPRAVTAGSLRIVPADHEPDAGAIRLIDAAAFGTGLHPTTALCLNAIDEAVRHLHPAALLDVGTGSGVLALAALTLGVPQAMGIDIDDDALAVAAENARLNGLDTRLQLARGGPADVTGTWPLVVANVLAAPLIEMAPALVRRVGHHGRLVLSGIPAGVVADVDAAYRRLGTRRLQITTREGWVALAVQATW